MLSNVIKCLKFCEKEKKRQNLITGLKITMCLYNWLQISNFVQTHKNDCVSQKLTLVINATAEIQLLDLLPSEVDNFTCATHTDQMK